MTQEFGISVTPLGDDNYLVRTERVAPGVPLAEEQLHWDVADWLEQSHRMLHDPRLLWQTTALPSPGAVSPGAAGAEFNGLSLDLIRLGQQFYSALFQRSLRDSWVTAQSIATNRDEMLRLRLGLRGQRLPRLPWEVLCESNPAIARRLQAEGGGLLQRPLTTGKTILFSRYLTGLRLMRTVSPPCIQPGQPLRILMAIASPDEQERLNLRQEALKLKQELSHRETTAIPEIQLTILEQPGREQLTQALEQGRYQVFHYAGHSSLGAAGGSLYLVNRDTGRTETLRGDDLAGLLVNNNIGLAVFNSCQGAFTAAADPVTQSEGWNLAESLVSWGVPAVVAMAERIPDHVALNFSRLFYRNLKLGHPIDLSLNRTRQGLISSYGSQRLYWSLPVLYMHPTFDGVLVSGDARSNSGTNRAASITAVETTTPSGLAASLEPDDDWMGDDFLAEDQDLGAIANITDTASITNIVQELAAEPPAIAADRAGAPDDQYPDSDFTLNLPGLTDVPSPAAGEANWDANAANAALPPAESGLDRPDLPGLPGLPGLPPMPSRPPQDYPIPLSVTPVEPTAKPPSLVALGPVPPLLEMPSRTVVNVAPQRRSPSGGVWLALAGAGAGLVGIALALIPSLRVWEQPPAEIVEYPSPLPSSPLPLPSSLSSPLPSPLPSVSVDPTLSPSPGANPQPGSRDGTVRVPTMPPPPSSFGQPDRAVPVSDRRPSRRPDAYPPPPRPRPTSPAPSRPSQPVVNEALLLQAGPSELRAIAIGQFNKAATFLNQNDYDAASDPLQWGNRAVELLLDSGELAAAEAALQVAVNNEIDLPETNFLRGRLAWQAFNGRTLAGYDFDTASKRWELAVSQTPTSAEYRNALALAYYAEALVYADQGDLETADQRLDKVLHTLDVVNNSCRQDPTSCAIRALVLAQFASQDANGQQDWLNDAIELRQQVLEAAPTRFNPDALARNWLWTGDALNQWQRLVTETN